MSKCGGESNGTVVQFSRAGLVHKTGDTMLGVLSMGGFRITDVGEPLERSDAATRGFAEMLDKDDLQLSGGTLSGDLNMGKHKITGLAELAASSDAATKVYVDGVKKSLREHLKNDMSTKLTEATKKMEDSARTTYLPLAGGKLSGDLGMTNNRITDLANPTAAQDAATKSYVDEQAAGAIDVVNRVFQNLDNKLQSFYL